MSAPHRIDVFEPTGEPYEVHVDETEIFGTDFSDRITQAEAEASGASVEVTFWQKVGKAWTAATLLSPNPFTTANEDFNTTTRVATWWYERASGVALTPGQYGVRIRVTLQNSRVPTSEHPLVILGAMKD